MKQKEPLELNLTITNNSASNQVCSLFGANFTLLLPKSVISNILVGPGPRRMDFNPVNNSMYAVNPTSNSVSVINCITNTAGVQILTPTSPRFIAYNSLNNTMYVSCFTSQDVSVIDCSTNTVINTIAIGKDVQGIAYNVIDNTMYVCASNTNDITVIDCSNDSIVTAIPSTGTFTGTITYNQQMNRMYATNLTSHDVSVVDCDTNTVISLISTGALSTPNTLAYNSLNNTMYVTLSGLKYISIIDCVTNAITSTIEVGTSPRGITYDRANNNMYVNNFSDGNCMIVNCASNTILATITLGASPEGIKFNPTNNNVYSAVTGITTISVIGDSVSIVPAYNVPYSQVLRDSATHPFTVGQIRMVSTNNSQVVQNMSILSQNIYGSSRTEPLTMEDQVSEYQYQAGIAKTNQEFDITGNVGFSFTILPNTIVVCTISIKQIIRMPTRFDSSTIKSYPIASMLAPINLQLLEK